MASSRNDIFKHSSSRYVHLQIVKFRILWNVVKRLKGVVLKNLVYKDQRSLEKKTGNGISCTNGKNLKPKCKSSVWSTTSLKHVLNVNNILCNVFSPFISFLYSMFLFFWVIEEIQAQCLWLLYTRNFLICFN